jgi:hypothetical protein
VEAIGGGSIKEDDAQRDDVIKCVGTGGQFWKSVVHTYVFEIRIRKSYSKVQRWNVHDIEQ